MMFAGFHVLKFMFANVNFNDTLQRYCFSIMIFFERPPHLTTMYETEIIDADGGCFNAEQNEQCLMVYSYCNYLQWYYIFNMRCFYSPARRKHLSFIITIIQYSMISIMTLTLNSFAWSPEINFHIAPSSSTIYYY
jgi:hypothetical protein